ncbi:phosphatase PAP2 family protein [Streptomyces sp. NPDC050738]|uniref:phosphatase PAP2 family protein n=1 Tax=Streptomyces sp. NPDC050738 TaxID=3154744 RepID=UPI00341DD50C
MRETPRPQGTAGDSRQGPPQFQPGRAFAHTTGASRSGDPHRSDGRPPHTPRGARHTDPALRSGTTPPDPERRAPLVLLPALCVALFALIGWQVASHGPLRRLDERVDASVVGRGPSWLTQLLADLGNVQVALPVLLAAMAYAAWRGARAPVLAAGLAMAVTPALVVPLKDWIARPGPLTTETGYFPSGHAATAMVAFLGAALLISPYLPGSWRGAAMPAAGVLTAATGLGLVLHGYHWPLDVLGSWCLCGALLSVSSSCTRRSSSRTPGC